MTGFDKKKLVEMVLYILGQTGGIDYYRIFKILYFAEKSHLAKWGLRIISDDFCALPHGPVPTKLYNAVKQLNKDKKYDLAAELSEAVQFASEDASCYLLSKREANNSFLSKSELEVLNESIKENAHLSFGELETKSHDDAWSEAFHNGHGRKTISPVSMAKVEHANEAMLEYIQEQLAIDAALA